MKNNKWTITIDLKSILIGLILGIALMFITGARSNDVNDEIRCKSLVLVDDDGLELIELQTTSLGGLIKVHNTNGYLAGLLGVNNAQNGQMLLFDKLENEMVFAGTSRESTGMIKTYYQDRKEACEFGKGFLYTMNPQGKVSGFIGTSSEGNGIVKTFDNAGREDGFFGNSYIKFYNDIGKATSYIGTAADSSGMIMLYDKDGIPFYSK